MEAISSNLNTSCLACEEELKRDHLGIRCQQGHDICPDCSKDYVSNMLSDPETRIPAKCPLCKVEVSSGSVEMQLTQDQLEIYIMHLSMQKLKDSEKVVNCPFCKYFEIWMKDCSSNFFYCKKDTGKAVSCSVCYNKFNVPKEENKITLSEDLEMRRRKGMFSHFKCLKYKKLKVAWDKAIEHGTKRFCPSGKVGGIKDDACTHMTCDNCQTVWCYFGGKPDDKLDKAVKGGSIYSHNKDWQTNERRCPMYLHQISQVDDRWPDDDDETGKIFFHKIRVYKKIREFMKHGGKIRFNRLCEIFSSIANHGYDIKEALKMDLTLIKR